MRLSVAKVSRPSRTAGGSVNRSCLMAALFRQKSCPLRSPNASHTPGCRVSWSVASLPAHRRMVAGDLDSARRAQVREIGPRDLVVAIDIIGDPLAAIRNGERAVTRLECEMARWRVAGSAAKLAAARTSASPVSRSIM